MPKKITMCRNKYCGHIESRVYDDHESEKCSYCGSVLKVETVYTKEEFQEILDALKLTNISLSYIQGGKPGKLYLNNIAVIEKVTGEKWEDIK